MSRAKFLTGTVGGLIGIIMAGIGIVWSIITLLFVMDLFAYFDNLMWWSGWLLSIYAVFLVPYPASGLWFNLSSFIVVLFLIVSGVLLGIGFYGLYTVGRKRMGIVGLIFSTIGSISGALLIYLGNTISNIEPIAVYVTRLWEPVNPVTAPWFVTTPNFFLIWIGLVILSVTFIVIGAASITTSGIVTRPSAFKAAGIVSIIGACFFFPYFLTTLIGTEKPLVALLGPILEIVGFALIFVAFILWSIIFYSSREI